MTAGLLPLVIVGAGGFGREVLQLVLDLNDSAPTFEVLGFVDDGAAAGHPVERLGAPLLGPTGRLADLAAAYIVAIGTPGPRRRLDALAAAAGRSATRLVHPTATVGRDVVIGAGAIVAAGTRLTTNIVVGRHAHLNMSCTVGHDTLIGDFVTMYAGVHLGGGCVIEDGATLGTGCVIIPNVRVGRDALVGAGAVVVHDVEPGATVVAPAARATLRSRTAANGESGAEG